jgi:protein-disulfide isomerase
MPSGKKSKQQRRVAAGAPPPVQSKGSPRARQANPRVLAAVAGVLALVVIGIVLGIVLSGGGGGGSGIPDGTPTTGSVETGLPGAADVEAQFKGIPQDGLYLGSADAPAEMMIFIDLQCPFCQNYETTIMPTIIDDYVKPGKLRIQVQPWAFLGPDSTRGQRAMFAAAEQDKAWNFADILFLNQGAENTGWLDDSMVAQAAASIPGLNVPQLFEDKDKGSVGTQISDVLRLVDERGVTGTPTVFVGKAGTNLKRVGSANTVPDLQQTTDAIDAALNG